MRPRVRTTASMLSKLRQKNSREVKNRALGGAVVAAAVTAFVGRKLATDDRWMRPKWRRKWERENHRGGTVTLYEGPAVAAGLTLGAACAGATPATRAAGALAAAGAGVFGVIDDLEETTTEKGLRGHIGALARGKLTTGGLKILGIGATSLAAAALARRPDQRVGDVLVNGALIASSANLANLFDLRPGRVLKVSAVTGLPLAVTARESGLAGAVVGASLAAAPGDLAEETMAGDGGANALGAVIGSAVAFGAPRWASRLTLAGVVALTVASERWSFSKIIDSTPWLRAIDGLGRVK